MPDSMLGGSRAGGGIAEWPLAGLGVHAGHEATGLPRYSRLRPSWPGLSILRTQFKAAWKRGATVKSKNGRKDLPQKTARTRTFERARQRGNEISARRR